MRDNVAVPGSRWVPVYAELSSSTFVGVDSATMVVHDDELVTWIEWVVGGPRTSNAPDGRTFQYDIELARWGFDCRAKRIRIYAQYDYLVSGEIDLEHPEVTYSLNVEHPQWTNPGSARDGELLANIVCPRWKR